MSIYCNPMQQVIQLGATRVVVPGNFPIGCFPAALTFLSNASSQEFDEFGCSRSFNDLAIYQNNNLQDALNLLRLEFPNVVIIYADYYGAFRSVLGRAPLLGNRSSCCFLIFTTLIGVIWWFLPHSWRVWQWLTIESLLRNRRGVQLW